jgi:Zn-dependent protease with chaperone function
MPYDLYKSLGQAQVLHHGNASGIVSCVEELAKKGKTITPKLLLLPTSIANAAYHPVSGTMWITEGLLKLFGDKNLHSAPSRELKAVMAHEMGHVKFRYQQFGPMILLIGGLPLAGMGAMYLISKTNQKLKENKELHPEKPKEFWNAFSDVTHDMKEQGAWQTYKDFWSHTSPSIGKLISNDPKMKEMSWSEAGAREAQMLAVQAGMMVPALAAARPLSLASEYQADRFAVALTGNTDDFMSALKKLSGGMGTAVRQRAHTPLERSWSERIVQGFQKIMNNTIAAHPEMGERMAVLSKLDPQAVARSFHL